MELETIAALGLKPLEAQVLLAVMTDEELTLTTLCSATGSGPQAVSAAVDALVRRRLLDRLTHRRPHVVFLHSRATESLDELVEAVEQEQQTRAQLVAQAAEQVRLAVRRRHERGRPAAEQYGVSQERRGRTSHDQVLEGRWAGQQLAPRSLQGCPARLLVTEPSHDLNLQRLAHIQQPGSEVRVTDEPLPPVSILDGQRVMAWAGTPNGRAIVWSWDGRHVRAAQELFELWWTRAGPGMVKPYPSKEPEPEWDVEEWDPADL